MLQASWETHKKMEGAQGKLRQLLHLVPQSQSGSKGAGKCACVERRGPKLQHEKQTLVARRDTRVYPKVRPLGIHPLSSYVAPSV